MEFAYLKHAEKRKKADLLVIPYFKNHCAVALEKEMQQFLAIPLSTNDFKGKEGEIFTLYPSDSSLEKRVVLVGLGEKELVTTESLRRSYGSLTKSCLAKKIKKINLLIPSLEKMDEYPLIRGIAEGLFLPNYHFNRQKFTLPEEAEEVLLEKVTWIGTLHQPAIVEKFYHICRGVDYTRDLVNGNADAVTPAFLAQCAEDLAKDNRSIKTTIFDKKRIQKEKLSLLLAVNRGSSLDPVFMIVEYRGNPKSKDQTVLVGKGITYDTGGLNLKSAGMEVMKCDMAGAAACLGAIKVISNLKLKVNVTAVIPATENGIDANSFKPGDVYPSYSGKFVEMMNSDAEGRLVLADALSYASKNLKPSRIIDLATLTGAIEIALGSEASGLMSTNDELSNRLIRAGDATFERLWRMPLYPEYKERLKSDIGDLKSWNGRSAGANVAAAFLSEFVDPSIPWAHIDIAATAYNSPEAKKYLTRYASGFGVRLLVEFLENLIKEHQ